MGKKHKQLETRLDDFQEREPHLLEGLSTAERGSAVRQNMLTGCLHSISMALGDDV